MKILSEEEVYLGAKKILLENEFIILGSQPPRGIDHYPVIEIKYNLTGTKGSKHSYKPDIVAYKDGYFYIVECKPKYSKDDFDKIHDVFTSAFRIGSLFLELSQRSLFDKIDYMGDITDFSLKLRGILAYSGDMVENLEINHIIVESFLGIGSLIIHE